MKENPQEKFFPLLQLICFFQLTVLVKKDKME
jgi:hypothetical protein